MGSEVRAFEKYHRPILFYRGFEGKENKVLLLNDDSIFVI